MKYKAIFTLLLWLAVSCDLKKSANRYSIDKLYIGFSTIHAYMNDKTDSARLLPPPPPPFDENIATNNIFEAKEGGIYYYSFVKRPLICGYMTEDGKYKFELYGQDLDTLTASSLYRLNANNVDSIVLSITNAEKPIYVSIGIQNITSINEILIKVVNILYKKSHDIRWKVRKVNDKENKLLNQLLVQVANWIDASNVIIFPAFPHSLCHPVADLHLPPG